MDVRAKKKKKKYVEIALQTEASFMEKEEGTTTRTFVMPL